MNHIANRQQGPGVHHAPAKTNSGALKENEAPKSGARQREGRKFGTDITNTTVRGTAKHEPQIELMNANRENKKYSYKPFEQADIQALIDRPTQIYSQAPPLVDPYQKFDFQLVDFDEPDELEDQPLVSEEETGDCAVFDFDEL